MTYLPLNHEKSNIFGRICIPIREDVHFMVSSGKFKSSFKRDSKVEAPIFELSYSRLGDIKYEIDNNIMEIKKDFTSLNFLSNSTCYSEYEMNSEINIYSIWIGPNSFNDFHNMVNNRSKLDFSDYIKKQYSITSFKMDNLEGNILNNLDNIFIAGNDRLNYLYLESKLLELISLNLEKIMGIDKSCSKNMKLTKEDIKSLYKARTIVLTRLNNPPSLLELSHLVNLNDCKLKKAFKYIFNMTVYEFVREQRLEKALYLIEQEKYNVSQAANSVGYINLGHFSKIFKEKFGILPSKIN